MKKLKIIIPIICCLVFGIGCSNNSHSDIYKTDNSSTDDVVVEVESEEEVINNIIKKYDPIQPTEWGEKVNGVVNKINTKEKIIALTFDACGGKYGSDYDNDLIQYLIDEQIPATLFVNRRWIEVNKYKFLKLSNNDLFEIENHGYEHRPLSVTSNSIYGINGTGSIKGVIDEIKLNEKTIYELTGRKTKYFRSGTAYYDDVSIKIASDLGYKAIGFSVNSDAGATFSKSQIENALSKSTSGDIVICHFNQPKKYTFEGLQYALKELRDKGYSFVKLEDTNI